MVGLICRSGEAGRNSVTPSPPLVPVAPASHIHLLPVDYVEREPMKRLLLVVLVPALVAAGWQATATFRVKHPVSGRQITVPGHIGVNAMLPSGWGTTPAGRHLRSGDMILSGQVSPDGKLFAFTNTGYT